MSPSVPITGSLIARVSWFPRRHVQLRELPADFPHDLLRRVAERNRLAHERIERRLQAALPLEALSTGTRALGLGLFYALWFLGFALLPSVGGWTRDVTGDPAAPILLGVGLLALTAPMLGLFRLLQRRWR